MDLVVRVVQRHRVLVRFEVTVRGVRACVVAAWFLPAFVAFVRYHVVTKMTSLRLLVPFGSFSGKNLVPLVANSEPGLTCSTGK